MVSGRSSCDCLKVFAVVETGGFEPAMVLSLILNSCRSIKYISKDIQYPSVSVAQWLGRRIINGDVRGSRPHQEGIFFQSVQ